METQWNVGMNGAQGLRYEVLFQLLDRRFAGDEWDETFKDIRHMEIEAIKEIRKQRDAQ